MHNCYQSRRPQAQRLVASPTQPMWLPLPLGTDTLQTTSEKHAFVAGETAQWRAVAASTDCQAQAWEVRAQHAE